LKWSQQIILGLAAVVVPIALAGLVVGGVGVNGTLCWFRSPSDRRRSVCGGVLGARKSDVLAQFLIEAIVLTGVGGLIGIAFGLHGGLHHPVGSQFPAAVPLWAIMVGFLTSVTVGLIAGMWPAIRAARLDPVVAIRGE
jgi:putative ABC transport system permease protein